MPELVQPSTPEINFIDTGEGVALSYDDARELARYLAELRSYFIPTAIETIQYFNNFILENTPIE